MTDKYLPIEDLANTLSVHVATIRKWVKQGQIPSDCYINVGRKAYRFDIPAVLEALKKANKKEVEAKQSEVETSDFELPDEPFNFDDEF